MQKCSQTNTENYNTLKQHLEAQAEGILRWQDQQTGGWYQIMDEDNTYKANSYSGERWTTSSYNNYIETSASTIFAAALFKAVRLGLLGDSYKAAAKKAFEGIVENFVVQDSNNETINIWSSSLSAGLGGKAIEMVPMITIFLAKIQKSVEGRQLYRGQGSRWLHHGCN